MEDPFQKLPLWSNRHPCLFLVEDALTSSFQYHIYNFSQHMQFEVSYRLPALLQNLKNKFFEIKPCLPEVFVPEKEIESNTVRENWTIFNLITVWTLHYILYTAKICTNKYIYWTFHTMELHDSPRTLKNEQYNQ